MPHTVLDAVVEFLNERSITYRLVRHAPTRTSAESAEARGEDLRLGGKALLLKVGDQFCLFVLSAALKLDSPAIKKAFNVRKVRFATTDELLELAGLAPGSVPPFGRPILPFDLFVDEPLLENERIAFNAGSLTDSIIMSMKDYIAVAEPRLLRFSAPPSGR